MSEPQNHGKSPLFSHLVVSLFEPLTKNLTHLSAITQKKPQVLKGQIIERFINQWRKTVGDDIYPAFRLVMPDKDKERDMYGLKEKNLGRIILKTLSISPVSPEAQAIKNWKQNSKATAGDFSNICYDIIQKREVITSFGDMTIEDVNNLLNQLSTESVFDKQLEVFQELYNRMNAEELRWIIRIVLRYVHLGATEKTIFNYWHPDAVALFNVTSSLKRVCYELFDSNYRLPNSQQEVSLMSCFVPQLASYQKKSYDDIIKLMPREFYIEEKFDGERIQLHMSGYGSHFKFWSRKAKDYTYLYGSSYNDTKGSLTKYLKDAFNSKVSNIILDGEMVAWDTDDQVIVPFGSLKASANEKTNTGKEKPMYCVFDILFLNNVSLVRYSLQERRKALNIVLKSLPGFIQIVPVKMATGKQDITQSLQKVIQDASEGIIVKDPRARYIVSQRSDSWIKVKPEYTKEFGENLDVCVIGGYYGSGRRGQKLASFLCGLRSEDDQKFPQRFWSFCRVGGGFTSQEYAHIQHITHGKWHKWDPLSPPLKYMELAGQFNDKERPDLWIKPENSVILEIKAAQVRPSDSYRAGLTLRFPRFRKLRDDRSWETALSFREFIKLRQETDAQRAEKQLSFEQHRRKNISTRNKLQIIGAEDSFTTDDKVIDVVNCALFNNFTFYIMSDVQKPRVSKGHLERLIKAHGGQITQFYNECILFTIISDKITFRLNAILPQNPSLIVFKPSWVFDCIENNTIVKIEPGHLLHATIEMREKAAKNVDKYGLSIYQMSKMLETKAALINLPRIKNPINMVEKEIIQQKIIDKLNCSHSAGFIFAGLELYFDRYQIGSKVHSEEELQQYRTNYELWILSCKARFAGAKELTSIEDSAVTHIITPDDPSRIKELRFLISSEAVEAYIS
ncbi:ATP-dependent DNA ligase [Nadsonia fulvescens var. elongata DSM 6958]|uniref:DNA ligase n=1 Tax=Nadsonia fulvescens var. elongata DSM 6958 TaxID=857566 RepID=A0A1E3PIA4_9ASCO|nr:ATP-dependent DNA ligase [Nadsonia fulvescens var. elongata DSM 6958]